MEYALKARIMDTQLLNAINMCSKIIAFFTIISYVLLTNELSLQQVLILLAWLENMRFILFMIFGSNLMFVAKGYYSSLRVQVRTTHSVFISHIPNSGTKLLNECNYNTMCVYCRNFS